MPACFLFRPTGEEGACFGRREVEALYRGGDGRQARELISQLAASVRPPLHSSGRTAVPMQLAAQNGRMHAADSAAPSAGEQEPASRSSSLSSAATAACWPPAAPWDNSTVLQQQLHGAGTPVGSSEPGGAAQAPEQVAPPSSVLDVSALFPMPAAEASAPGMRQQQEQPREGLQQQMLYDLFPQPAGAAAEGLASSFGGISLMGSPLSSGRQLQREPPGLHAQPEAASSSFSAAPSAGRRAWEPYVFTPLPPQQPLQPTADASQLRPAALLLDEILQLPPPRILRSSSPLGFAHYEVAARAEGSAPAGQQLRLPTGSFGPVGSRTGSATSSPQPGPALPPLAAPADGAPAVEPDQARALRQRSGKRGAAQSHAAADEQQSRAGVAEDADASAPGLLNTSLLCPAGSAALILS